MSVLTNPIFWMILAAIVIVMALIGYLADGTEFANKALSKNKKKDKSVSNATPLEEIKKDKPENIEANQPLENNMNEADLSNSSDIPTAWTDNAVLEDEKQETTYAVPTIDDWSVMPTEADLNVPAENTLEETSANDTLPHDSETILPDALSEETLNNESMSEQKDDIIPEVILENPNDNFLPSEDSTETTNKQQIDLLPNEEILTPISSENKESSIQKEENFQNEDNIWQ